MDDLTREEFLRLLNLKSTTLDQRVHKNEMVFFPGLSRPAAIGDYSALDGLYGLTSSMLNGCAKIELKDAADLTRTNWEDLAKGFAKVERQMETDGLIFFAVATVFGDDGKVKKISGAVGTGQQASNVLQSAGKHASLYMLPLYIVLRTLRNCAKQAKPQIQLPTYLIPAAPDTPEFETWLAWVREYRRRAILKHKAKKAKAEA